jgi:ParB/RepB/Spo0J family partition protein
MEKLVLTTQAPAGELTLEYHQLDLRYESLRPRSRLKEQRLAMRLEEQGQQVPIVTVAVPCVSSDAQRFVVIDGYKRLRALRRLRCDVVRAVCWGLSEADALVLARSLEMSQSPSTLEQGWLLAELERSLGLGIVELSRRFDRSPSWVSQRLSLVRVLPETVQEHVRAGRLPVQAALRSLVPLARKSRKACERLADVDVAAEHRLSTPQIRKLYDAWCRGTAEVRERLLAEPLLYLRSEEELRQKPVPSAAQRLLGNLEHIVALAHRTLRQYNELSSEFTEGERECAGHCLSGAMSELSCLQRRIAQGKNAAVGGTATRLEPSQREEHDVEQTTTHRHPGACQAGPGNSSDRSRPEGVAQNSAGGPRVAVERAAAASAAPEGGALPGSDSGVARAVQGQHVTSPRGTARSGGEFVLSGPDRVLPPTGDWNEADRAGWPLPLLTGPGDPTRHLTTSSDDTTPHHIKR